MEAAERLRTDQAKVPAIVRGRLDQFSIERLLQYAQMIGYDVEIPFQPSRRRRSLANRRGIRGIGGMWGIDSGTLGSASMIQEWGYPRVGIVV